MQIGRWLLPLAIAGVCGVVSLQPASAAVNISYQYYQFSASWDNSVIPLGVADAVSPVTPGQIQLLNASGNLLANPLATDWCYDLTTPLATNFGYPPTQTFTYTVNSASGIPDGGEIGALVAHGNSIVTGGGADVGYEAEAIQRVRSKVMQSRGGFS